MISPDQSANAKPPALIRLKMVCAIGSGSRFFFFFGRLSPATTNENLLGFAGVPSTGVCGIGASIGNAAALGTLGAGGEGNCAGVFSGDFGQAASASVKA